MKKLNAHVLKHIEWITPIRRPIYIKNEKKKCL